MRGLHEVVCKECGRLHVMSAKRALETRLHRCDCGVFIRLDHSLKQKAGPTSVQPGPVVSVVPPRPAPRPMPAPPPPSLPPPAPVPPPPPPPLDLSEAEEDEETRLLGSAEEAVRREAIRPAAGRPAAGADRPAAAPHAIKPQAGPLYVPPMSVPSTRPAAGRAVPATSARAVPAPAEAERAAPRSEPVLHSYERAAKSLVFDEHLKDGRSATARAEAAPRKKPVLAQTMPATRPFVVSQGGKVEPRLPSQPRQRAPSQHDGSGVTVRWALMGVTAALLVTVGILAGIAIASSRGAPASASEGAPAVRDGSQTPAGAVAAEPHVPANAQGQAPVVLDADELERAAGASSVGSAKQRSVIKTGAQTSGKAAPTPAAAARTDARPAPAPEPAPEPRPKLPVPTGAANDPGF